MDSFRLLTPLQRESPLLERIKDLEYKVHAKELSLVDYTGFSVQKKTIEDRVRALEIECNILSELLMIINDL